MKMNLLGGSVVDLSVSQRFMDFANKPYSMSKLIVDQFNSGKFPDIPGGDTFLDIGGNVGLFSIFVSPCYKTVAMLEPTPEHLEVAEDLIDTLGVDNIEIIPKAYWPYSETVKFNVGQRNSTMNSIASCQQVQTDSIEVDCITLERLFELYPGIRFIKMDIEGAENTIYKHADFENIRKAEHMLMEVHSFPDLQLENIRANLERIKIKTSSIGMQVISDDRDELFVFNPYWHLTKADSTL